jgi:hypothetical protein
MRSSAGRTNRWKVTIADTGLPGKPKHKVPARAPKKVGLPGRSATPQKTSSTPSAANAGRTWSCGPTDTPPVAIATSAASACSRRATVAARSSPTVTT